MKKETKVALVWGSSYDSQTGILSTYIPGNRAEGIEASEHKAPFSFAVGEDPL